MPRALKQRFLRCSSPMSVVDVIGSRRRSLGVAIIVQQILLLDDRAHKPFITKVWENRFCVSKQHGGVMRPLFVRIHESRSEHR